MTLTKSLLPVALGALLLALLALGTLDANAAPKKQGTNLGTLVQLKGPSGCLVDRSRSAGKCASARALKRPGPFMGSNALAVSPDGKNVYVASSRSNAIAIFTRKKRSGKLIQRKGKAGCIAAEGAGGCAVAAGLYGPNSVSVSPDGRNVYASSRAPGSVTAFERKSRTGALTQTTEGGCFAATMIPGCLGGLGLTGADVVAVSPDGKNVYVGSFAGNAVATFARDSNGGLSQATDGSGCLANEPATGCTTGIALEGPEGLAISADGKSVYVASAISSAVLILTRDPASGELAQAVDGQGCIVAAPLAGCTQGLQISGANAVAVSPDDGDVYVTALSSQSVSSFTRSSPGALTQKDGTAGCLVFLRAVGCSFGRALDAPEGVAVSPDGANVYVAAYGSSAIDVLDRDASSGAVAQKAGHRGCVSKAGLADCSRARKMRKISSIAVSPDGRNVYSTAFGSDAVGVFSRKTSK